MINPNLVPESRKIGELNHSSEILECMELVREHGSKNIVFEGHAKGLSENSEYSFFRGMTFDTLEPYLGETPCKSGGDPQGISYRIYPVPEGHHGIVNMILGVRAPCDRHYRIYIQTEEGIVDCYLGEYGRDRFSIAA